MENGQSPQIQITLDVSSAGLSELCPRPARLKYHPSFKRYFRHITVLFGIGESLEFPLILTNSGDFYCVLTPSITWLTYGSTASMWGGMREVKRRLFWM